MDRDRVMRGALWAAASLNLIGIAVFLSPNVVGAMARGLPQPAPRFYTTQFALVLALFAGAYAWLARQPVIDRPLVAVGILGEPVSTPWPRFGGSSVTCPEEHV